MNIKKMTLIVGLFNTITLLPSSREYERAIRNGESGIWNFSSLDPVRQRNIASEEFDRRRRMELDAQLASLLAKQPRSQSASSSWNSSQHILQSGQFYQLTLSGLNSYAAHECTLLEQKLAKYAHASNFVQQNKFAYETYQNINAQLQTIAELVHSGNIHNRKLIEQLLEELRMAYDELCWEYSPARLELAQKNYNNFVQEASQSQAVYNSSGERITHEIARQQLLTLEQNTIAVHHLKSELNNLIDGLELALYKKGGGFLKKPRKEFDELINIYQKQYAPGNNTIIEIETYNQARFARIKGHRSNVAIDNINHYLADGNLAAAEQVVHNYNRTLSQQKYKEVVRECLRTNPQLNELGIPRICAETNPHWQIYQEQLLACPDSKSAIAQQMYHEHVIAQDLCQKAGIEHVSHEQLQQAHHLLKYKEDPNFLDFARNALQDSSCFLHSSCILEQRANAIQIIQNALDQHPAAKRVLNLHYKDLLCYAADPNFEAIINTIAHDPSRIQEMEQYLAIRSEHVMDLQNKLVPEEISPTVSQLAYNLINTQDTAVQIAYLGTLAADCENRDMYKVYYDQVTHLPKIYTYDETLVQNAREIDLPDTLGTQEFGSERMLYTHVMSQPVTSDMQREQAQQYLQILKPACSENEHQDAYRALSHVAGQLYLHPTMQTSDVIQRQNIALCDSIKHSIECGNMVTAANNLSMLQYEIQNNGSIVTIPEQVQNFIQQHVTVTIAETTQANTSAASSDMHTNSAVLDFDQLLTQVHMQHAAIFQQTGALSEYYRSREDALASVARGNFAVQEVSYTLSPQAHKALEKAGIDVEQFTKCTGNAIQQDTHAKLINNLNALAEARPLTPYGNLIKKGAFDCAQTGTLLNQAGHVREAMSYADLCTLVVEKALYLADVMSPFVMGTRTTFDVTTALLHAASAHDLAQSLDTLRTNIDQFRTGLAVGIIQGATDFKGIYDGLCNTITTIKHFAEFAGTVCVTAGAIDAGDYELALKMLDTYDAHAARIATAANHFAHQAAQFVEHIPDMTSQEWRQVGIATGQFAGREAMQLGVIKVGISGLSKLTEGIAQAAQNFDAMAKELVISAYLAGSPATASQVAAKIYRTEQVAQLDGTRLIHALTNPESISRVMLNEGTQVAQQVGKLGAEIAAENLNATSPIAALVELGKQLGQTLTSAQPGFLQLPGSSADVVQLVALQDFLTADKKIDISELDLNNLPLHLYDGAVCSGEQLQSLVQRFKDTPGALGKDGPLQKLLELGYNGAEPGRAACARGALYELEVANRLERVEESILRFGERIHQEPYSPREFDIVLPNKLIECKNIYWENLNPKNILDMQSIFSNQHKIASATNRIFEVYSKQPIPQFWKDWFNKKNIIFREG